MVEEITESDAEGNGPRRELGGLVHILHSDAFLGSISLFDSQAAGALTFGPFFHFQLNPRNISVRNAD
jgi:hypothetical protein